MEEIALTRTETWQYVSALSRLYTRITEPESSPHAMGLTLECAGRHQASGPASSWALKGSFLV